PPSLRAWRQNSTATRPSHRASARGAASPEQSGRSSPVSVAGRGDRAGRALTSDARCPGCEGAGSLAQRSLSRGPIVRVPLTVHRSGVDVEPSPVYVLYETSRSRTAGYSSSTTSMDTARCWRPRSTTATFDERRAAVQGRLTGRVAVVVVLGSIA